MPSINRVQQVEAPRGIARVETGAVQFGDDWPGLFVRGDNARALSLSIRRLADLVRGHPNADIADEMQKLTVYADLIDDDVIVH